MDIPEKLTYLHQVLHDLEMDIMREIPKMPEEWGELELRWFIEDRFHVDYGSYQDKRSVNYKKYQKACLEKEL